MCPSAGGGERALGRVDRNLGEVRAAEPFELRVQIGEDAALQQRVVREVDARHDVLGAERDLLGLGEEVVGIAIEHHPADRAHRNQLFGNELGRIEQVEVETCSAFLVEELHAELPLGKVAGLDRLPQIAPMKVRVRARDLHGLVPHQRLQAQLRPPVELDERRLRPAALTRRNVWTPKPSMMRKQRGIARSDMIHITMCVDSGVSETKSQKVSCAVAACGNLVVRLRLHRVDRDPGT